MDAQWTPPPSSSQYHERPAEPPLLIHTVRFIFSISQPLLSSFFENPQKRSEGDDAYMWQYLTSSELLHSCDRTAPHHISYPLLRAAMMIQAQSVCQTTLKRADWALADCRKRSGVGDIYANNSSGDGGRITASLVLV